MDGNPKSIAEKIWRWVLIALWAVREILRTAWAIARGPIILALQILAALVVLFEEWGWKPLSALLERLAKYGPIAFAERLIARLPPYAALAVFAVPVVVLLPLKFVAVWLLSMGRYWSATALFAGAKIASTALIARIFSLTKPQLMQIGWFAGAYNWFVPWKESFFALIRTSWAWRYGRMLKNRITLELKQLWLRHGPAITRTIGPRLERAKEAAADLMLRLGRRDKE